MRKLYHNGFEVSAALKQSGSFVYTPFPEPFEAQVLVVAGGGGGGHKSESASGPNGAAGGGAGGLYFGNINIGTGVTTIRVGSGGGGGNNSPGGNGGRSFISGSGGSVYTLGGGGGGSADASNDYDGRDGGSGGGAAWTGDEGQGLEPLSGSGHFGRDGGAGLFGGGGGGAGGAGADYNGSDLGAGGAGKTYSISGTSRQYAKGGNGVRIVPRFTSSAPGSGGYGSNSTVTPRPDNSGKDGIVIVRYASQFIKARGGILTRDGDYFIHTFTSSGVLKV